MKVCPTCSRPIGGKGRFCFACKLPILRAHKWHIVGCYIVHDDCANPFMHVLLRPPEEQTDLIDRRGSDLSLDIPKPEEQNDAA